MRRVRPLLVLFVALLFVAPAWAGPSLGERLRERWELFRAEREIENTMVRAHLRGLFGKRPPRPSGRGGHCASGSIVAARSCSRTSGSE